jgi:hypothetical protein
MKNTRLIFCLLLLPILCLAQSKDGKAARTDANYKLKNNIVKVGNVDSFYTSVANLLSDPKLSVLKEGYTLSDFSICVLPHGNRDMMGPYTSFRDTFTTDQVRLISSLGDSDRIFFDVKLKHDGKIIILDKGIALRIKGTLPRAAPKCILYPGYISKSKEYQRSKASSFISLLQHF